MIRISLKGLAKIIEASPASLRRILREFKYPDTDEAKAMRMYYQDAVKKIASCHRTGTGSHGMKAAVPYFLEAASQNPKPQAAKRLRHNARAISQYADAFGDRQFEVLTPQRLSLEWSGVTISVAPDLTVREKGKLKLLKLEFAEKPPTEQTVKTLTQCLFEAAKTAHPDLAASSVLLLDVPRGKEFKGARVGARTIAEIEATCLNVAQLWPTIEPPSPKR